MVNLFLVKSGSRRIPEPFFVEMPFWSSWIGKLFYWRSSSALRESWARNRHFGIDRHPPSLVSCPTTRIPNFCAPWPTKASPAKWWKKKRKDWQTEKTVPTGWISSSKEWERRSTVSRQSRKERVRLLGKVKETPNCLHADQPTREVWKNHSGKEKSSCSCNDRTATSNGSVTLKES